MERSILANMKNKIATKETISRKYLIKPLPMPNKSNQFIV
jgi:hypothetical protein